MIGIIWFLIGMVVGFLIAWIIGKVLASREFDQLLYQEEQKHQELLNKFNDILFEKDDVIDDLKQQLYKREKNEV